MSLLVIVIIAILSGIILIISFNFLIHYLFGSRTMHLLFISFFIFRVSFMKKYYRFSFSFSFHLLNFHYYLHYYLHYLHYCDSQYFVKIYL